MENAIMKSEFVDEKIYTVNRLLNEGKDKNEVARVVGYRDISGFDKYAKRLGYIWNKDSRNYELKDGTELMQSSSKKVSKILSLINEGMSIENIAKYFRMKNSQELADYMNNKGYEWNSEYGNYIKSSIILNENEDEQVEDTIYTSEVDDIDIMKLLESNKGKLIELLSYKPKNTIPRYLLKGMPVTKGFFISIEVDRLIKNFSREKNISQKDIIQTALIEFFKKYGFKDEVDILLRN